MTHPSVDISIVLCTFNRSDMLSIALEWLRNVETPDADTVEVVIVDNASTDQTAEVVQSFAQDAPFPTRYVFESRPGLSIARNAGIEASRGDIVVFTDDDCFVSSGWLRDLVSKYRNDALLAGIGGRVELYDHRDLPLTIRTSDHPSEASTRNIFAQILGCNMSFRRSAFEQHGLFDEAFGAGSGLRSAEDSDFLYRLVKAGQRVQYLPQAVVFHAHGRRTAQDAKSLSKNYVIGRGGFYCKHILAGDKQILKQAYWELRRMVAGSLKSPGAMESLRSLGQLLRGMSIYVPVFMRRKLSRSKSNGDDT